VDELVDWLIEKNKSGYKMVNSVKRLQDMKDFMRGKVEPWNCRAGQNSIIMRVDGTLVPASPCTPQRTTGVSSKITSSKSPN
jgi:hypothetical protein